MIAFYYAFTLLVLLFSTNFILEKVKHCPFQYKLENGALCKQFNSTMGNRVFSECSFGREYVNPNSFAPIEVCSE